MNFIDDEIDPIDYGYSPIYTEPVTVNIPWKFVATFYPLPDAPKDVFPFPFDYFLHAEDAERNRWRLRRCTHYLVKSRVPGDKTYPIYVDAAGKVHPMSWRELFVYYHDALHPPAHPPRGNTPIDDLSDL